MCNLRTNVFSNPNAVSLRIKITLQHFSPPNETLGVFKFETFELGHVHFNGKINTDYICYELFFCKPRFENSIILLKLPHQSHVVNLSRMPKFNECCVTKHNSKS